ncbi:hypothetical protein ACKFKG_31780 [Phormidesmis sp. 146-35]
MIAGDLLPGAISELYADAASTGKLTIGDRYTIRTALVNDLLDPEEQGALDRLLYAFRKGNVQLVEELSAIL